MKGARKRSPDRGCGIEVGAQMIAKTSTKGRDAVLHRHNWKP